jgi:hypothetical protein
MTPVELLAPLERSNASDIMELKEDHNEFPVDLLPRKVQDIIADWEKGLDFNRDFISNSIISSAAAAIGATARLLVKEGWTESSIVFMALLAPPGTNKSAPAALAYKPIHERDAKLFEEYRIKMEGWIQNERMKECKNTTEPKPRREQTIVKDATIEAVFKVLSANPRGICINQDELAGIIKGFTAYSNGNAEEHVLSFWSNQATSKDRKTDEPIFIENPVVNIFGTIQPAVVSIINKDNGLFDRFLWVVPTNIERPQFSFDKQAKAQTYVTYKAIIDRLLDRSIENQHTLQLTAEAKEIFLEWSEEHRKTMNNDRINYRIKGVYAKMERYVFRFSLIIQMLHWACDEGDCFEVSGKAMRAAVGITEYFKKTAIKIVCDDNSSNRRDSKKEVMEVLPETFKTSEGVELAKTLNVSERTFKNWLNDGKLFEKISYGHYKKKAAA